MRPSVSVAETSIVAVPFATARTRASAPDVSATASEDVAAKTLGQDRNLDSSKPTVSP